MKLLTESLELKVGRYLRPFVYFQPFFLAKWFLNCTRGEKREWQIEHAPPPPFVDNKYSIKKRVRAPAFKIFLNKEENKERREKGPAQFVSLSRCMMLVPSTSVLLRPTCWCRKWWAGQYGQALRCHCYFGVNSSVEACLSFGAS